MKKTLTDDLYQRDHVDWKPLKLPSEKPKQKQKKLNPKQKVDEHITITSMPTMKKIFSFDGIKVEITPPDLDGDGEVGGIETIQKQSYAEQDIVQTGELSESIKELFKDDIDPNTRMSALDMRTRIHPIESAPMVVWDTLVSMRILPKSALMLTTKKSRYAVSLNGQGRKEIRDITIGKREQDAMTGSFNEKVKAGLGMNQNQN